jgi:hypothetical protein
LGVKPVDDKVQNPYLNADHAGTPENFKPKVIGGLEAAAAQITPAATAELFQSDHARTDEWKISLTSTANTQVEKQ